ncbi:hypothetical protein GQ600_6121 [Phytophthora cactorum]|nr:hypothetical protein GQ600_6121 [Phytophthora cactorum]
MINTVQNRVTTLVFRFVKAPRVGRPAIRKTKKRKEKKKERIEESKTEAKQFVHGTLKPFFDTEQCGESVGVLLQLRVCLRLPI